MKKKKKIRLGSSDFKSMIESNAYYVDKSLLIEEVIDSSDDIILLPRPRRFGKTLNLTMLRCFFDIQEPENSKLFTHLQIWQSDEEIKEKQGKYPVIYISLKDVKANNWEKCYQLIRIEIIKLFREHRYLLDSDILHEDEVNLYKNILSRIAEEADYQDSLKFLSDCLHRYHKQKVVILIDEYDTPIQSAYNKYYDDAIDFVRGFMSGAYKDNYNLYKGVVTGILRVSRESIFSGLNNIGVFSVFQDEFSDKFGFTETEVKQLIDYLDVGISLFDKVKMWYDGYKFGTTANIYNPWSILTLFKNKSIKFKPHWTNTSSNELIKNEIKNKQSDFIRNEILELINGNEIAKDIEENFVFPDLETRKDLLWTLFVYSGYLTINEQVSLYKYKLRIPNYEIKTIFKRTILEWFEGDVRVRKSLLEDTVYALVNNDLHKFEEGFKQIIGDTFSYYDTAINHEYVYQSYLLGMLAIIGDDYILKSNRESGEGRYDIMMIPHDKTNNGIVIEIKRIDKNAKPETIKQEIKKALSQIEDNKYYKELIDNKVSENNIVKAAIVFAGKEPFVNA